LSAITANDRRPPLPAIRDFATWAPLLAILWGSQQGVDYAGGYVDGQVDCRGGFGWHMSPGLQHMSTAVVRAVAEQTGVDPIALVREALADAGMNYISFVAEFPGGGRVVLHLIELGPAVEVTAGGIGLGSLVLVEGALPELWRRQPAPAPRARPAESADPELLERTLRERLPDAVGATDAEIAAAESRLGIPLPDELKVLYQVTGGRWGSDAAVSERVFSAVGCYPYPPDQAYIATPTTRRLPWVYAAMEAAAPSPSAAVQTLVGSPGWIVFGGPGTRDRVAIDLTPGPRGNVGQVIMIRYDEYYGARLFARSLTDLVMRKGKLRGGGRRGEMPAVARVNRGALRSIEAVANPDLEVLSIGVWEGEPLSLAPVADLPRLRTLQAMPGTLADPLEIAGLTRLEFLALGPEEWRVLLDAGAVPRTLSAAAVDSHDGRNPLPLVAISNELLTLWGRPQITQNVLKGDLLQEWPSA
jgi:cell wall assembly regulator SMI1